MLNRKIFVSWVVALAVGFLTAPAQAGLITQGFSFAVANDGGASATGTHFHSNSGGIFGNPAGKAEVGSFSSEQVRGLSEYNILGQTSGPAFVTFNVFKLGGLFAGTNAFPFTGNIDIVAYQGNNTEDISDYQAPSIRSVGTFSTAGLAVGDTLSFDITTIYNIALTNGISSLGIRLQIASGTVTNGGALTFDTFRLTTTNDSSATAVPEPTTLSSTGMAGLIGIVYASRHRKRIAA